MALTSVVDTVTREFLPDAAAVNGTTVMALPFPRNPDPAIEKWDGNLTTPGFTPKSAGEMAAYQVAQLSASRAKAQAVIDAYPIELRALVLALVDALNVIRAALPAPLPPITAGQGLAAIRAKAATLS